MSDRVTKVRLSATVAEYVSGMEEAAKATRDVTSETQKLEAQKEALDAIGKAAVAVGALAAAGVAVAVAKFAEFDQQMSSVQAATHESAANMALLRQAALDAGADTVFSATEAAQAVEELAKAGVETKDVLGGGLKGALDLAAAGQINVADAAETAASAMTQFGLAGKDVPHIADLLAAGAGKAQGSVGDLSAALNQSGLVASQMGLSIEETVGTLAAFASAGLVGSDAGTSFRAMLLRLANPTDEAKAALDGLGISLYNSKGEFVGTQELAGQLARKMAGLTEAQKNQTLALVFGQDAIRGANILMRESSRGIEEWTNKVNDAGYAAETAEMRMDNLAGDIEKLGGALDTALIKTGSGANDALRALVQSVTDVVDGFAEAPAFVQDAALAMGALTAAVGLAGGTALLAIPKFVAFKASLEALGVSTGKVDAALGVMGATMKTLPLIALGAWAAEATGGFIDSAREALGLKETVDSLISSLDELGTKKTVDDVLGEFGANTLGSLTDGGWFSDFNKGAQEAVDGLSDFMLGFKLLGVESNLMTGKLATVDAAMAKLVSDGKPEEAAALYEELAAKTNGSKDALAKLDALLPQYVASQDGASAATEESAEKVDVFTEATDGAKQSLDTFIDALRNLGDTQLQLEDAQERVAAATEGFQKSLEANGQTLDVNTEAGRANRDAVQEIARAYSEQAAAQVEATGKAEDAIPIINAGREAVINARVALGESREAAEAYADQLGLTPKVVETQIRANWDEAMTKAREVARAINEIPGYRDVVINQVVKETGAPRGQVGAAYNANGGMYSYQAFANGGFAGGFYAGRGGGLYKFAEPETRWEAFISGKQGMEERNRGIALEAYRRLGGEMPQQRGGDTYQIYEATNAREVAAVVSNRQHLLGAV